MNRIISISIGIALFATLSSAQSVKPRVSLMTSKGEIVVELDSAKAPNSVKNFVDYVNSGFYDGTIFHRVIKNFMIQGGGFTPDMNKKATKEPIKNEANNRVSNRRGTIAMARTPDPHSATAQFFINTVDNFASLDYKSEDSWGYCVFGKVISGMAAVDAIAGVATKSDGMMQDIPVTPVLITKATVIKAAEAAPAAPATTAPAVKK